jgi:5'-3' exonuclease
MGVPYLYLNLYKKYKKIKDLVVKNTDLPINKGNRFLYFDFNSLIHPCAVVVCESELQETNFIEDEIINFVITITKNIIKELNLDYTNVIISADGLAPFGKIIQQKERRYKSIFLKLQQNQKVIFDNTQISPGTNFMKKLEQRLKTEIDLKNSLIDFSKGEAEHKILKDIKLNRNLDSEIYIYGLDADLILLSIMTNHNISLVRQKNIVEQLHIEFEVLNIRVLKEAIVKEYSITTNYFFNNLIFTTFLLGNDFIKKLPFVVMDDLSNILHICSNLKGSIIDENFNINNNLFKIVLNELFKMSICNSNKRTKHLNELEYTKNNWINNKNPEWIWIYKNDYINYPNKFYKEKFYIYNGIKNFDIKNLCKKFVNNLIWNYIYYQTNVDPSNYTFFEINCSPIINDLIANIDDIKCNTNTNNVIIDTEEKQLKYILPSPNLISKPKNPNIILEGYDCEWIWETKLV